MGPQLASKAKENIKERHQVLPRGTAREQDCESTPSVVLELERKTLKLPSKRRASAVYKSMRCERTSERHS